ncbi:MAG: hypothetical protein KDD66_09375 [Bdellovibrionales bacterium]|nr:hypothetical protein [Bdellovibrionales bacterium]
MGERLNDVGSSLIEFIVAISLIGIVSGAVVSNMKVLDDPLTNASFAVEHFLRLTRGQAMSRTISVVVQPTSSLRLQASYADSCAEDAVLTPVSDLVLDLPRGASLVTTDWSVCFTQRGFADVASSFELQREDGELRTIEIALGGGSRTTR